MTHFHWDFIWSARFVRLLHISSSPVDWFKPPEANNKRTTAGKAKRGGAVGWLAKKKKNSSHSHTWIMEKKRNIWPQVSRKQIHYKPRKRKPARGGTQQMFIRGGPTVQVCCRPEVQPLTLSFTYHFLRKPFRKRYPFRIPSIDKWYPFHIPCFEFCIPFKCCTDTLSFFFF